MMEGCVWVEILKFMLGGGGGQEKHVVLLRNLVKHLSNGPSWHLQDA